MAAGIKNIKAKTGIRKLCNQFKKLGYECKASHGYSGSHAFVHNPLTDKWIYLSIDDESCVNLKGHRGADVLLYRTATGPKDFTGGANNFVVIDIDNNNFAEALTKCFKLLAKEQL